MAMDPATLAAGFEAMQASGTDPGYTEATAIQDMADALIAYWKEAVANGSIAIVGTAVDAQRPTVVSSLAGMKAAGPTAIQLACVTFWTTVAAAPTPFFAGTAAPGVPSASLATIAVKMLATAAVTIAAAPPLPVPEAALDLATAIHEGHTTVLSTVTLVAGPSVVPIT